MTICRLGINKIFLGLLLLLTFASDFAFGDGSNGLADDPQWDCPLNHNSAMQARSLSSALSTLQGVSPECQESFNSYLNLKYRDLAMGLNGNNPNSTQKLWERSTETINNYKNIMQTFKNPDQFLGPKCAKSTSANALAFGFSRYLADLALSVTDPSYAGAASAVAGLAISFVVQTLNYSDFDRQNEKIKQLEQGKKIACEFIRFNKFSVCLNDEINKISAQIERGNQDIGSCISHLTARDDFSEISSFSNLLKKYQENANQLKDTVSGLSSESDKDLEADKIEEFKSSLSQNLFPDEDNNISVQSVLTEYVEDVKNYPQQFALKGREKLEFDRIKNFVSDLSTSEGANNDSPTSTYDSFLGHLKALRENGFRDAVIHALEYKFKKINSSKLDTLYAMEKYLDLIEQKTSQVNVVANLRDFKVDRNDVKRVFNLFMEPRVTNSLDSYISELSNNMKSLNQEERCEASVGLLQACAYLNGAYHFGKPVAKGSILYNYVFKGQPNDSLNSLQES